MGECEMRVKLKIKKEIKIIRRIFQNLNGIAN
jgi:hypothetical protein